MKKLLLVFMLAGFAVLGANHYDKINGNVSKLEISKKFISLKLTHSTSKAEFKKEILAIKYLPEISEIKTLSDNSFVIKFKEVISSSSIDELKKEYKILPSYTFNQEYWPLITDNTINIKFKNSVPKAEQNRILSENNLEIIDTDIFIKTIHAVKTDKDAFYMANKLYNTGLFDFSNPNFYMYHIKKFTPNDTYFSSQWHHNADSAGVYSEGAWDINRGSSSIKIAIIDDGMELNHPDLNVVNSKDFSGSSGFSDSGEHGTSCGGVAAAKGNNGIGVSGACQNCSILAAKIMRADGYSLQYADANAFNWATSNGADVFNNSWGYQQDFVINDYNPRLVSAINYAVTNARGGKGGVVLFASGNENRRFSSSSLEGLPNIIAVGATTNYGSRASYSNYGSGLDIVAPSNGGSLGIWTTDRLGSSGYNDNGHYTVDGTDYGYGTDLGDDDYSKNFGGTSSATPLVSGIAGLMLSENANLTPSQVRQILENSADKIGSASNYDSSGHSDYLGYGKVNAKKALEAVRDLSGCTPDPNGENCSNNIDDDCDGAIDDNDSDCQSSPDACDGVNCPANSHCDVDNSNEAGCYCNDGYHVNDDYTACVPDGGSTGVCDGVDCNQYYPNSVCIDNGGQAACSCPDGWNWNSSQTACEQGTTDPCVGIYCSNHGTCINNGGVASCDCNIGYSAIGLHCVEDNVDPCAGIVCSNHGLCANYNGTAACNCDAGYISDGSLHCLLDNSDPCNGVTCSNHGICGNYSGVAKCNCNTGYHSEGLQCIIDENTDPCDGVSCSNHGICGNYSGVAKCNCNTGYHSEGLQCVINDVNNPCEGVTCGGNGSCEDNSGNIICNCNAGYHSIGLDCVLDEVDPCEGIFCSNNGVCANYDGVAKCNCNIGYHSDNNLHCLLDGNDNPCENILCSNHGQCVEDNDSISCNCNTGYHPDNNLNCLVDLNVCDGITCSGHGVCANYNSVAKCNCDSGYHSDDNLHCIVGATDVCASVTCGGHGSCYDNSGTAACNCDSGFHPNGAYCAKDSSNGSDSSSCSYSSSNDNSLLFIFFIALLSLIWVRKKYNKLNN